MNLIKVDFKKPMKLAEDEQISLREVWKELESKREFTNWAEDALCGFTEGEEFGSFDVSVKRSKGATRRKEFWVTTLTAWQIGMMTKTPAGKRVRMFFIDCMRLVYGNGLQDRLKNIPNIMDPDFIIQLATELKEERALKVAAQEETREERAAHQQTKENSKISSDDIKIVEDALQRQAEELHPHVQGERDFAINNIRSVLQKMVKCVFARPRTIATFKEIKQADLQPALRFIASVTPEEVCLRGSTLTTILSCQGWRWFYGQ